MASSLMESVLYEGVNQWRLGEIDAMSDFDRAQVFERRLKYCAAAGFALRQGIAKEAYAEWYGDVPEHVAEEAVCEVLIRRDVGEMLQKAEAIVTQEAPVSQTAEMLAQQAMSWLDARSN